MPIGIDVYAWYIERAFQYTWYIDVYILYIDKHYILCFPMYILCISYVFLCFSQAQNSVYTWMIMVYCIT